MDKRADGRKTLRKTVRASTWGQCLDAGANVSLSGEPACPDAGGTEEGKAADKQKQGVQCEQPESFLVRIWREGGARSGEFFWRGHITNVLSGRRKYVQSFEGIIEFIAGYLPPMGVTVNWRWRTILWVQELKRRWRLEK